MVLTTMLLTDPSSSTDTAAREAAARQSVDSIENRMILCGPRLKEEKEEETEKKNEFAKLGRRREREECRKPSAFDETIRSTAYCLVAAS